MIVVDEEDPVGGLWNYKISIYTDAIFSFGIWSVVLLCVSVYTRMWLITYAYKYTVSQNTVGISKPNIDKYL